MLPQVADLTRFRWPVRPEQPELPAWEWDRLQRRLADCLPAQPEPILHRVCEKLLQRRRNFSSEPNFDLACVTGSMLKIQRGLQPGEHRDRTEWHSSRSLVGVCTAELAARSWTTIDPALASHTVLLFETSIVAMSRLLGPDYRRLIDRVLLQCPPAFGSLLAESERGQFGFSHVGLASVFATFWAPETLSRPFPLTGQAPVARWDDSGPLGELVEFADRFSTWCQWPGEDRLSTLLGHPVARTRAPETVCSLLQQSIDRAAKLASLLQEPPPFQTARGVIDAYLRFFTSSERKPL